MEEQRRGTCEEITRTILEVPKFKRALKAQMEVSHRLQVSCALLLLRLEYEELYSDHFGKSDRDVIRSFFSELVVNNVRDTDTVGWVRDDSLGVVLRVVTAKETGLVATRLQKHLAKRPMLIQGLNLHLAVQVGGVWYSGQRPMKPYDLIDQAFAALTE